MKICKKCGIEKPRDEFYKLVSPKYKAEWDYRDSYCKDCRCNYASDRRREFKVKAIEYLGGACVDCGLENDHPAVYDFHHIDPTKKDFSIGKQAKAFESIKLELDKCILLCCRCHRIRHT